MGAPRRDVPDPISRFYRDKGVFDTLAALDLHPKLSLCGLPLEGEQLVELAFVRSANRHRCDGMMSHLEVPSVRSSGRFSLHAGRASLSIAKPLGAPVPAWEL